MASSMVNPFRRQPTIKLLTDYGRDEAPHLLESAIKFVHTRALVEHITHDVPRFGVLPGATRLARVASSKTEPRKAIYVAVVDPGVGGERKPIIVEAKSGQLLVGPDNGLLHPAWDALGGIRRAVQIQNKDLTLERTAQSKTFDGQIIFGPAAAHLARGIRISEFGEPLPEGSLQSINSKPVRQGKSITGYVLDIDDFGNMRTNLQNDEFRTGSSISVAIRIDGSEAALLERALDVREIFEGTKKGEFFLVLSSTGFLDIVQNQGNAGKALGLDAGSLKLGKGRVPNISVTLREQLFSAE